MTDRLSSYGYSFQIKVITALLTDKMYTVIKDLDTWLSSAFNPLNAYRSL